MDDESLVAEGLRILDPAYGTDVEGRRGGNGAGVVQRAPRMTAATPSSTICTAEATSTIPISRSIAVSPRVPRRIASRDPARRIAAEAPQATVIATNQSARRSGA